MPLWLLLLGAGIVVVAATGKSHVVDEAAITAVTKHALVVEKDVPTLRKLQDLLSHAGRFELATLVKAKADAIEAPALLAVYDGIKAPKGTGSGSSQPFDPQHPYYENFTMPELLAELAKVKANYAQVAQTPYGQTHPQFLATYASNISLLEAWIKSHGGSVPQQQQQVQMVQQLAPVMLRV